MKVNIKKVAGNAIVPTYATDGSGCFDLYCTNDGLVGTTPCEFNTGWEFEVPQGFVMLVFSRSGHGFNKGIRLSNCVGVIDSDYRGEVKVKLTADDLGGYNHIVYFKAGERVAQALILPYEQVNFNEVDELGGTARGSGGFGSTG